MFWILVTYLSISLSVYQAAGQKSAGLTNATFREEALPNPLIIPWGVSQFYCTGSPDWIPSNWSPSDCSQAIQKLHDIEVTPKRGTVYEFVEAGAPQKHPFYYGQATPRNYTYGRQNCSARPGCSMGLISAGTCTVGIVMMDDATLGNVCSQQPTK